MGSQQRGDKDAFVFGKKIALAPSVCVCVSSYCFYFFIICNVFFNLMFILFFKRERRDRAQAREGQRETGRERIPSRLHTVDREPGVRLNLTDCEIMT